MLKWSAWISSEEGVAKVLVGQKSVTILFRCQEDGHRKGLKNAFSVTILLKKGELNIYSSPNGTTISAIAG